MTSSRGCSNTSARILAPASAISSVTLISSQPDRGFVSIRALLSQVYNCRKFAGNLAVAEAAKWLPVVGSVVAGSLSFVLMQQLAFYVIDKCHELALALLDKRVDAEAAMA